MLVAFFKEEKCNVKVIKFCDRIWIDEEGNIECHREIYLDLIEGSLRKIFMLTNFRHILELEDITDTFLNENYPANNKSSGVYKLINHQKRIFSIDFIDSIYALQIKSKSILSSQINDCSYIEAIFDNEINAPIKCALRFKFKINSITEKLEEENYLIELPYFDDRECQHECAALRIFDREIKAIMILDMKTKSGGFDVLVHLPYEAKNIEPSERFHKTHSKLEPTGKEGANKPEVVWHIREFFDDEVGREIGMGNGIKLSIKYSKVSIVERVATFRNEFIKENELLKEEIEKIKSVNQALEKRIRLGGKLQKLSILLAFIAMALAIILRSCS